MKHCDMIPTNYGYDPDITDPVEDQLPEHLHLASCPACGKGVTDDMDSCPFCGDILYRSLRHGTFMPRKGPLARFVAAVIVILIALLIMTFIWVSLT